MEPKTWIWEGAPMSTAGGQWSRTTSIAFKQFWKMGKRGDPVFTGTVYRWKMPIEDRGRAQEIADVVVQKLNHDPGMTAVLFKYVGPDQCRKVGELIRKMIKEGSK